MAGHAEDLWQANVAKLLFISGDKQVFSCANNGFLESKVLLGWTNTLIMTYILNTFRGLPLPSPVALITHPPLISTTGTPSKLVCLTPFSCLNLSNHHRQHHHPHHGTK